MRAYLSIIAATWIVAACGDTTTAGSPATAAPGTATASQASASGVPSASAPAGTANPSESTRAAATPGFNGRTGELLNPDDSTMVLLYYDLAGMTPPIDNWVEDDNRVKYAPGADKASLRKSIRAELETAAAAVRGIGTIRLSMNANLSEYDPTYSEFLVRALAPSSVVSFRALGQNVSLKFGNGRTAQIWRVPQADAQAIRDKIGYASNASLDVLLRISGVQPGPGGGTITTDVVEYEMQTAQSGLTIARVQVGAR